PSRPSPFFALLRPSPSLFALPTPFSISQNPAPSTTRIFVSGIETHACCLSDTFFLSRPPFAFSKPFINDTGGQPREGYIAASDQCPIFAHH
ncbi:MAG: hypothetical protein BJ554DRAFT_1499, partial [Olpidium bornovanus]